MFPCFPSSEVRTLQENPDTNDSDTCYFEQSAQNPWQAHKWLTQDKPGRYAMKEAGRLSVFPGQGQPLLYCPLAGPRHSRSILCATVMFISSVSLFFCILTSGVSGRCVLCLLCSPRLLCNAYSRGESPYENAIVVLKSQYYASLLFISFYLFH